MTKAFLTATVASVFAHLDDMNLAMGNLTTIAHRQIAAYTATH